jgi:hypothetical protein
VLCFWFLILNLMEVTFVGLEWLYCQVVCGNSKSISAMRRSRPMRAKRRGVSSMDYMLLLGVILPMAVFIFRVGPKIIRLAYEMVCVLVSWPFM